MTNSWDFATHFFGLNTLFPGGQVALLSNNSQSRATSEITRWSVDHMSQAAETKASKSENQMRRRHQKSENQMRSQGKRLWDDPGLEKPVASLGQIWTDCFDPPPSTQAQATKYFVFLIFVLLYCADLPPSLQWPQSSDPRPPRANYFSFFKLVTDRQTKIKPQTPGSVKNIIRKSWMKRRRGAYSISKICLKYYRVIFSLVPP